MRYFATFVVLALCGILLGACVRGKLPAAKPPAAESPSEPPSDDVLEKRAGAFVGLLAAGKYDDAVKMMDSKMAGVLPSDKLREAWEALMRRERLPPVMPAI